MQNMWVIGFLALFAGAIAWLVTAGRRQRKAWLSRADVLRTLALRHSARADEHPEDPAALLPMKPLNRMDDVRSVELPVVVRGTSADVEYRLFDMHTIRRSARTTKNPTLHRDYDTYVTITSSGGSWPQFEFAAVSDASEDSAAGRLLGAVGTLAEAGRPDALVHIPIPNRPGFQLYVADAGRGQTISNALMKTLDHKTGWWVAAIDRTLALSRASAGAQGTAALVPEADLDGFLNEAIAVERVLRAGLITQAES